MISVAKREAHARYLSGDLEEDRTMMKLRVMNFIERSKTSFDLRNELAGLKLLAQTLGLTRTEGGGAISDMLEVIRTISDLRNDNPEQKYFVPTMPKHLIEQRPEGFQSSLEHEAELPNFKE